MHMSGTRILLTLAAMIAGLIGLSLFLFIVIPNIVRGEEGSPGPPVSEVYEGIANALRRQGTVVIVTDIYTSDDPAQCRRCSMRHWIDSSSGTVRTESTYRTTDGDATDIRIIRDGIEHFLSPNVPGLQERPVDCLAARDPALSMYAPCFEQQPDVRATARVDTSFDGRKALMILWKGDSHGIDSTVHLKQRLYVDAESFLPVGFKSSTADEYALGGHTDRRSYMRRFTHEFIARDSLPADFFDIRSVSYSTVPIPVSPP
jgi:hypothetical protein